MAISGPTTNISSNYTVSTDVVEPNREVKALLSGDSGIPVQFLVMKLGMALIKESNIKMGNQLKDMTANLNKMTAANQLKENITTLRALRTNDGVADAKTMGSYSSDTSNFMAKAERAGVNFSATEATNWRAGNVTNADIDAVEARVKTMQDAATNSSQADNMKMQMINTAISQFTNMAMAFLDEIKKAADRIWR